MFRIAFGSEKTIKSAHITELRSALDAALTALGLPAGATRIRH
jgi:hypothetical protein